MYEPGEEADARRARALPLIGQNNTRMLDHVLSGPDLPAAKMPEIRQKMVDSSLSTGHSGARKFAELLGKLAMRRGGRVVEGTRLLIWRPG